MVRIASENLKYFGHIITEIFTLDRDFNWLLINMKNIIVHELMIYVESITGSTSSHTQTATLYP